LGLNKAKKKGKTNKYKQTKYKKNKQTRKKNKKTRGPIYSQNLLGTYV